MQIPAASPLIFAATLLVAAGIAAVSPAGAATPHLSDVAYLNAARCAGLAEGMGRDASAIKAVVDREQPGRESVVLDRADEARSDAAREARRAGDDSRRHLTAEADGCSRYTSTSVAMGAN